MTSQNLPESKPGLVGRLRRLVPALKKFPRKKWFRRCCQGALVAVSLLALGWMIFNWYGARLRRDAIARMEAAGWPADLSDVLGNLPPDATNYAMIPLLKEAREEMDARSTDRKWTEARPGSARARLAALFEQELIGKAKRRGTDPKAGTPDFSALPPDGPYGNTPGSFLEEYDRRNGETIRELVAGLSLLETRQPVGAAKGANWFALTEAFGLSMRSVCDGLSMRAYAAMVTGDSAKAVESLVVLLRLGEVVGSRNFVVSHALQRVMVLSVAQRVKQGIEMHAWTEADLERLREAFAAIKMRERLESCVSFTGRVWVDTWSRWESDRSDLKTVVVIFPDGGTTLGADHVWNFLPAGFFSMNAAEVADRWLDLEKRIRTAESMAPLLRKVGEMRERNDNRGMLARILPSKLDIMEFSKLVEWGAQVEVIRHQAMLACDLEIHRLKNSSYPSSLAGLSSPVLVDPLFERPFIYRKEGDAFVLYSTGPDDKDDGGVKMQGKGSYDQPDWVW